MEMNSMHDCITSLADLENLARLATSTFQGSPSESFFSGNAWRVGLWGRTPAEFLRLLEVIVQITAELGEFQNSKQLSILEPRVGSRKRETFLAHSLVRAFSALGDSSVSSEPCTRSIFYGLKDSRRVIQAGATALAWPISHEADWPAACNSDPPRTVIFPRLLETVSHPPRVSGRRSSHSKEKSNTKIIHTGYEFNL